MHDATTHTYKIERTFTGKSLIPNHVVKIHSNVPSTARFPTKYILAGDCFLCAILHFFPRIAAHSTKQHEIKQTNKSIWEKCIPIDRLFVYILYIFHRDKIFRLRSMEALGYNMYIIWLRCIFVGHVSVICSPWSLCVCTPRKPMLFACGFVRNWKLFDFADACKCVTSLRISNFFFLCKLGEI